jgi:uncharacterized protein YdhG (YjbR/CyaY superfamily)
VEQPAPHTVAAYLASLPPERRKVVSAVRAAIRKGMPKGYRECMGYGMIMWSIPLSVLPDTYNGHPLCYVALAAQKNHYAAYLMGAYGSKKILAELQAGYKKAGIRLDMGKACVRFKSLDGVALDVIRDVVARIPVAQYVEFYRASRVK